MRKFIQNYSILVFPALIGCAMLMTPVGNFPLYVAVWGIIGTITVLMPMLFLSKDKIWYIRLLYGFIGIILFYVLIFFLHVIYLFHDDIFKNIIVMGYIIFKGSYCCLITFFPANIAVVLAFLLNDIYAQKIGKIICNKKEAEDEI